MLLTLTSEKRSTIFGNEICPSQHFLLFSRARRDDIATVDYRTVTS